MSVILNKPDEVVATHHEELEVTCCDGCDRDLREDHKHFWADLTHIPILAKNCSIADKCEVCHCKLLETEF